MGVHGQWSPWTYVGRDKQPAEVDNWLYLTASGGWAQLQSVTVLDGRARIGGVSPC